MMRLGIKKIQKLKNSRGFMLADAMLAVLIVAIALTALALLYTQGTKATLTAVRHEKAVQIAGEWMEYLKMADGKKNYQETATFLQALRTKKAGEWTDFAASTTSYDVKIKDQTNAYSYRVAAQYQDADGLATHSKLKQITVTVTPDDPKYQTVTLASYIALQ
ncbi:MAG: hypothetical protein RR089_00610 [Acidaminococcaceae bacterium]